ncbi:small multi-drug export protein [Salsuginibacillus kocurii]|uniref:small multi-drug export protein n=1 Tax=Salsuginibacillus kocurii TaxID=427078 RepID=UPI00036BEA0C|nr:small multi-drug export protein [Salsuginibacillus kocurii]
MWEYLYLAATAWLLGYVPFFEIYLAIPAVMMMGFDPVSAVIWGGLGNFMAVPTILFFHKQLAKVPRLGKWLHSLENNRFRSHIEKYGATMVVVLTVVAGVWAMAAIGRVLGLSRLKLSLSCALSIVLYSILTAYAVQAGLDWFL